MTNEDKEVIIEHNGNIYIDINTVLGIMDDDIRWVDALQARSVIEKMLKEFKTEG